MGVTTSRVMSLLTTIISQAQ